MLDMYLYSEINTHKLINQSQSVNAKHQRLINPLKPIEQH